MLKCSFVNLIDFEVPSLYVCMKWLLYETNSAIMLSIYSGDLFSLEERGTAWSANDHLPSKSKV